MGLPSFDEFTGALGRYAEQVTDDVVEFARNPANKMVDLVSGYDLDERDRVRDEQAAGNAERSDIYGLQAGLRGQFGGAYDPPVLTSPEAFESMSHEQIKSAVDAMSAEPLRASAEGWTRIGDSLEQALNEFRDFIGTTIGDNWKGIAADRANQATARYAEESTQLAAAGKLVGTKISEAATGVSQVKATMPPVAERSILETVFDVVVPVSGMFKRLAHDRDEAHDQAVQIMRTVYTPVMQQADTNVPTLPAPPQVTNDGVEQPSNRQPGLGAPSGGRLGSHDPYAQPAASSPHPGTPLPGADQPSAGAPGADAPRVSPYAPAADNAANDESPFTSNPNTTAAQINPASAWTAPAAAGATGDTARFGQPGYSGTGLGTSTGYAGGGPGAGVGGSGAGGGFGSGGILSGGYGSGAGGGGAGGGGAGGGGASGGGGPSASPAGGAAGQGNAGAAAAANGRTGTAAVGGMAPGAAARGRGDDDQEHKTPGYLMNVDNGNELIGKLPLAAPPVIGT
ncbi:PPE domain-containing protein [Rhodococcus sp. ABRD24]|uniref:PPE domain-containing protein n=1 Tax=Rhodococcus sp. ABRD24 TaxID=2507582 RepID=UPI0013F16D16|nr:PPE domain-containing protein [Rhodococcus sp. ABRD24]